MSCQKPTTLSIFLNFADAAALYPGWSLAIETVSQSGGLLSFKKKKIDRVYL